MNCTNFTDLTPEDLSEVLNTHATPDQSADALALSGVIEGVPGLRPIEKTVAKLLYAYGESEAAVADYLELEDWRMALIVENVQEKVMGALG